MVVVTMNGEGGQNECLAWAVSQRVFHTLLQRYSLSNEATCYWQQKTPLEVSLQFSLVLHDQLVFTGQII